MSRLPSPCVRSLAQTISSLCSVAEPSPVWLPSCLPSWLPSCCRRTLACLSTLLSPKTRLSDYPPVTENLLVWLPSCCHRTLACLSTLLTSNPHLSDRPSCCRTLACLSKDALIDYASSASLCVENLGSLYLNCILPHNIDSLSLTVSLEIFKRICARV